MILKPLYIVILTFFFALNFNAQQIVVKGRLVDSATNEGISFASGAIEQTNNSCITNEDGFFQILVSEEELKKDIVFTQLAYKKKSFPLAGYTVGKTLALKLPVQRNILKTAIVLAKPLPEVLNEYFENSAAKIVSPVKLSTYVREFVYVNGKISKFGDGLIDFYGYKKPGKMKFNPVMNQSRVYEAPEHNDSLTMFSIFGLDFMIEEYDLADSKFNFEKRKVAKKYDFQAYSVVTEDKELMEIKITPKKELDEFLQDVTVLVDPETKLILNIDIFTSEKSKKTPLEKSFLGLVKIKVYDIRKTLSFKLYDNGKYAINFHQLYIDMNTKFGKGKYIDDRLVFLNDLMITDLKELEEKPKDLEVYKKKTLIENGSAYTYNFWENGSYIPFSEKEQQAVNQLQLLK